VSARKLVPAPAPAPTADRNLARRRRGGRIRAIDGPDPIDLSVGEAVRTRRITLGMSQTALAESIGVTFQQLQKYETGANRISASVLYRLSKVLGTPVMGFFAAVSGADGAGERKAGEPVDDRGMLSLIRKLNALDERLLRHVSELVEALSAGR
jgi:transcriptional regulator with XRE-family HTH domain